MLIFIKNTFILSIKGAKKPNYKIQMIELKVAYSLKMAAHFFLIILILESI